MYLSHRVRGTRVMLERCSTVDGSFIIVRFMFYLFYFIELIG